VPRCPACILIVAPAGVPRRRAARALRRAGWQARVAADAASALAAALQHDPVLVAADAAALAAPLQCIGYHDALVPLAAAPRRLRRLARRRLQARRQQQRAWEADPAYLALKAGHERDLRQRLHELQAAVDRADAALARRLVHDIKGTAGSYGRAALSKLAADVQDAFGPDADDHGADGPSGDDRSADTLTAGTRGTDTRGTDTGITDSRSTDAAWAGCRRLLLQAAKETSA
jgi:HPt (histidine-containing phosphotransfer) domain-containing protein